VRPAASGGAFSGNGAGGAAAAAAARADGGRRERARQQNGGSVWGRGAASRPGGRGWSAAARPTPAYSCHVAAAGWGKAGAARGRERERRGRQAGLLAGPKGRRVGPAAPVPFSIYFF